MQQGFAIDGTLGLLLLTLPIVVMALAVIWAVRQTRTPKSAAATAPPRQSAEGTTEMQRAPTPAPSAVAPSAPAAASAATAPATKRASLDVVSMPAQAPAPAATQAAAGVAKEGPEDLAAAIAHSEAGSNNDELARLYIKQATAYLAADRKDEAASRLRDAIRIAALNRLAEPHALARLELGDLYLTNGDPTTACEQWQIARNLFHDLARPADRDNVDKRMLGNGCPSDWVLTDF